MGEDHKQQPKPTQLTQPKGIDPKTGKPYEPVEIPVPKRLDWERVLRRATKLTAPRSPRK
jgi:hypothetical protein